MHCVKRDVIIAELAHPFGVTNIVEKILNWLCRDLKPRSSRYPGEYSTIELHRIAIKLLCNSMSERACSLPILCVSDIRYKTIVISDTINYQAFALAFRELPMPMIYII